MSERTPGGQRILPNTVIQQHVGQTGFARGRAYANKGRVLETVVDSENGKLAGRVQGSDQEPYEVTVLVIPKGNGEFKIKTSDCDCPVGYACKHVAAVSLMGRESLYEQAAQEAEVVNVRPQALVQHSCTG